MEMKRAEDHVVEGGEGLFNVDSRNRRFSEWVKTERVREVIAEKFRDFLLTYVYPYTEDEDDREHGDPFYLTKISDMVSLNKSTLEIDYYEFKSVHGNVAGWLFRAPEHVHKVMEEVANEIVCELHPDYRKIHKKICLSIVDLPTPEQLLYVSESLGKPVFNSNIYKVGLGGEKRCFMEWVKTERVRNAIAEKFRDFLITYVDPYTEDEDEHEHGDPFYLTKISDMVLFNKSTLEIDYYEFKSVHANVAGWLFRAPEHVHKVMEEVANEIVCELHPDYRKIHKKICLSIVDLPMREQILNVPRKPGIAESKEGNSERLAQAMQS